MSQKDYLIYISQKTDANSVKARLKTNCIVEMCNSK